MTLTSKVKDYVEPYLKIDTMSSSDYILNIQITESEEKYYLMNRYSMKYFKEYLQSKGLTYVEGTLKWKNTSKNMRNYAEGKMYYKVNETTFISGPFSIDEEVTDEEKKSLFQRFDKTFEYGDQWNISYETVEQGLISQTKK